MLFHFRKQVYNITGFHFEVHVDPSHKTASWLWTSVQVQRTSYKCDIYELSPVRCEIVQMWQMWQKLIGPLVAALRMILFPWVAEEDLKSPV